MVVTGTAPLDLTATIPPVRLLTAADLDGVVEEMLGEADGVLLLDGHETPKQGTHSVGVARQWCGHLGKQDNCQAGVSLGYASRRGYKLLDRRLSLPASWFSDEYRARWHACGIPRGTPF